MRVFFGKRDKFFKFLVVANSIIILIVIFMAFILFEQSIKIFTKEGISFLTTSVWNPVRENYGILFALGGSIVTAAIAVLIASILSIASAVTIVEILPNRVKTIASTLTDFSAGLPTVIYGLWGLYVLAPFIGKVTHQQLFFRLSPYLGMSTYAGASILTASLLLSIMITPFATAIIREALARVPKDIEEALYSLGLTKFEVIMLKLKYIRSSIPPALMIAYGRAVGETIAVAMVVGNVVNPDFWKILSPGYTISSLIANQYLNAESFYYMVPAIFGAALILFLIGLGINIYVTIITRRK